MRTRLLPLAALLAGACTLAPNYQPVPPPAPQAWRDSTPARDTSVADLPWWIVFRDTTLQRLIRTALAQNTDLQLAAENVTMATAQLRVARAGQLPALYASGFATTGGAGRSGYDRYSASATVSWEADLFGEVRSNVAAFRAGREAADEGRRGIALSVVAGVASAYGDLRSADQQLDVALRTVEARRHYLDVTRQRVQSGAAPEIDYRQAQVQFESARELAVGLHESIAQIENAICTLLGRAPGAVPRGGTLDDLALSAAVPPGMPSSLLERRPDVRAAERKFASARANVGVFKAQLFPRLILDASGGWTRSTSRYNYSSQIGAPFRGSQTVETWAWGLTASLDQPLYVGGRYSASVSASESELRQVALAYRGTVLTALREAEDALAAVRFAAERRAAVDSQVVYGREVLRLAETRYESGGAPYLEVVDAQRTLLAAELSAVGVRAQQVAALIGLYKALGGGWQADSTDTRGAPNS
jgi:multidrug efflux system outer membrane protein